ncbi:MAG: FxsA family protein [Halobacteriales archaeon]
MLRVLALLLLIPLFDVVLLVVVAREVGGVETVAIVVLTALVGLMLARFEGRRNLRRIETALREGDVPTDRMLDGALILAAGILLLTPGLVTDAVGLLLLVSLTRWPIRVGLKRYVIVPYLDRRTGGFVTGRTYTYPAGMDPEGGDDVIDVEVEVEDADEDGNA